jgi:hypothetical protein
MNRTFLSASPSGSIGAATGAIAFIIVVLSHNTVTSIGVIGPQGGPIEARESRRIENGASVKHERDDTTIRSGPTDFKSISVSVSARQVLDFVAWQAPSQYSGIRRAISG